MIKKFKNSKAFTLIELIVVIGVIGILVLIASSNFSKQTEKAKHNAALADMKIVADATDMYNIDNNDWPRLSDVHYTADELKAYSESFYDATGKKATLKEGGKYYDIDYDKLSQYAKAPVNKENYILQNPAGKVFYMDNLTTEGKARVDYGTNKQANPSQPSKPSLTRAGADSITISSEEGTEVRMGSGAWFASPHTFEGIDIGQSHSAEARFKATEEYLASKPAKVNFETVKNAGGIGEVYNFAYTGAPQEFTVPAGGQYKLEVWGAQGDNRYETSGSGGYSSGTIDISKIDKILVFVGGSPRNQLGGWNGGGTNRGTSSSWTTSGGGGGGTDIRLKDSLYSRVIVAGGGGGGQQNSSHYAGGGGGINGLDALYSKGMYGTQTKSPSHSRTTGQGFGRGGDNINAHGNGSGGGGWYGGTPCTNTGASTGGGGGSGYVHTATSHKPSGWQLTEEHYLTNTEMIAGNQTMPNPQGGTMAGNTGHGFARITALDSWSIVEK